MAFQSAPGCAEAVITCSIGSLEWKNVLNFKYNGAYGSEQIADLALVVDGWVGGNWIPIMTTSSLYVSTLVRGLEFENDITYLATANAQAGDAAVAATAANVALCITHRTALTGRSARGRTYVGGIPNNQVTAPNTLADSFCLAWADVFNDLKTVVEAEAWKFVILSRFSGGVKRAQAVTFDVVFSSRRNNLIDSMKGRLSDDH
jgi:hypothetical protein